MSEVLVWKEIERFPYKVTKTESRFCCIFCPDPDTGFHLYVNRIKKVYHCFRCGAKGVVIDRSMYGKILETFEDRVEGFKNKNEVEEVVRSLPLNEVIPISNKTKLGMRNTIYRDYLLSRGIGGEKAFVNNIRVCKERSGPYANSLIFPVGDPEDPEYFVCRKIDGSQPKYVNAPWPKGDTLYYVKTEGLRKEYLAVCEGVFDALKLSYVIPAKAVALLGKEATKGQLDRLAEAPYKCVLICLDGDARTYAMRLATELVTRGKRVVIVPFDDTDPGATSAYLLRRKLKDAYLSISGRMRERGGEGSMGDGTAGVYEELSGQDRRGQSRLQHQRTSRL